MFLGSFKVCLAFPEKWFCIHQPNLALWGLQPIFHDSEHSIKAFGRLQTNFIGNFKMARSCLSESFKVCLNFPEKWFCIYWENLVFSSPDLPNFPHFAGDSRILKTIAVSPLWFLVQVCSLPQHFYCLSTSQKSGS